MGPIDPRDARGTAGEPRCRVSARLSGLLMVLAVLGTFLGQADAALGEKPVEKPVNTSPPTISGKAEEGMTLKAKEGRWSGGGSIVYSFQWQRCEPELECTNIPSATTAEYTARYVDIGSTLRALVTAS